MRLSVVTDELKTPFAEALSILDGWNVQNIELRGLDGARIPDGDVQNALSQVRAHGLTVTGLSPGVFKCACDEREIEKHIDRFRRTLQLCDVFGCGQVIVFSVQGREFRASAPPTIVVEALRETGRIAARHGVRVAIENEPGYTATGCRALANLTNAVDMENVGANWDPGNAFPFDSEINDAVRVLAGRIFNVHVKDTVVQGDSRRFDSVGKGQIDWKKQITDLAASSYKGCLVIETHCEPGIEKTRESLEAVRTLLQEVTTRNGG